MHRFNSSPLPRREGPGEGFTTAASLMQRESQRQVLATGSAGGRSESTASQQFVHRRSRCLSFSTHCRALHELAPRKAWQTLALATVLLATGCNNHPPLERPSYDLAKALYAVCNRQSPEHLAKFDEVLAAAIAAGKVGPQEESALRKIAEVAAAGEWYDAQEMARALIASQNS